MKNKRIQTGVSIVGLIALAYNLFAYLFMMPRLGMDVYMDNIRTLGNFVLLGFVIIGLYHLFLLANALKTLPGKTKNIFAHSVYIVLVILSGITLLSDVTLLSDIGKEFMLFDVTDQWVLLYFFTAVHILVVILGFVFSRNHPNSNVKLLESFKAGNDTLFKSMHQVALITGILGLLGIACAQTNLLVPSRFSVPFMMILSVLAAAPLLVIIVYWGVKTKALHRFDEKQTADTAFASMICLIAAVVMFALVCLIDLFAIWVVPVTFWILLMFFTLLILFSLVILVRNRT